MDYEKVYRTPPNVFSPILLLLIFGLLITNVFVTVTPRFAEMNSETSSALVADSDKARGLFWECIISSKVEFRSVFTL